MTGTMHLKQKLYDSCIAFVEQRINNIKEAISAARESADEETKSVVGDKYETGRAMIQLELENYAAQLGEAKKLEEVMSRIRPTVQHSIVEPGSLVVTNLGNYYIAISVGKITVETETYFAIAPGSPIGAKLTGLRVGDSFEWNGKQVKVEAIA